MDKERNIVYCQELEKAGLEYLRKVMEFINAMKVCLNDIGENNKKIDNLLKIIDNKQHKFYN